MQQKGNPRKTTGRPEAPASRMPPRDLFGVRGESAGAWIEGTPLPRLRLSKSFGETTHPGPAVTDAASESKGGWIGWGGFPVLCHENSPGDFERGRTLESKG